MTIQILQGDCRTILPQLPTNSIQCVVCSPPYYGLRDYNVAGQIGLEASPDDYVAEMVAVFRAVRRVLRPDGVLFLNLGDSYASHDPGGYRPGEFLNPDGRPPVKQGNARNRAGNYRSGDLKPKDLMMMPARVALALQADGWWLRSDIIWAKPNPMPESVTDRPTSAHEHVFLLAKAARYYWDADAVRQPMARQWNDNNRGSWAHTASQPNGSKAGHHSGAYPKPNEGGANCRSVWTIATQPYADAHFATFPPELAERCIKAGSRPGDTILDPFAGAFTAPMVADRLQRHAIGIELNADYCDMARRRLVDDGGMFMELAS